LDDVADLAKVWSVDIEAPEVFEPLVDGGRVFVGREGRLFVTSAVTAGSVYRVTAFEPQP
jgi:hypothetical protein